MTRLARYVAYTVFFNTMTFSCHMNRLPLTDCQAAAAPYNKSRNRVCSGSGKDHTLVKPAVRALCSEGAERARLGHCDFVLRALAA